MIDFQFQCNGRTAIAAVGNIMEHSAGAIFLISQLYHKGLKEEKKLFRLAIEHAVMSGFCWDENHDVIGKGITVNLDELQQQMEDLK